MITLGFAALVAGIWALILALTLVVCWLGPKVERFFKRLNDD